MKPNLSVTITFAPKEFDSYEQTADLPEKPG